MKATTILAACLLLAGSPLVNAQSSSPTADARQGAPSELEGLHVSDEPVAKWFETPIAVRNRQPVIGEEITVLRTFRIRKGTYPEFYRRSEQDIWPYFEKVGARVVGMWQVKFGVLDSGEEPDYDEAVLMTRYASIDHWKATRSAIELGGNGPDAEAMVAANAYREGVTIETTFKVLEGKPADNGPYYMPSVD